MRIGQGFDAHRFASHDAGKPLWLACLRWDGDGIEGDSDGDVAAHALIDALLSAAGLGDIGMLFGVGSDSAGAGKHGDEMLRATVAYLRAHGMRPASASVVGVANRPKIGKRRDEAQQALSHAIGCEVSLTATTTDGMGFTGSGEGIAAIASAMVKNPKLLLCDELTGARKFFSHPLVSTLIMVVIGCGMGFMSLSQIWGVFGAANQLLAGIAMLAVAAWLGNIGKNNKMFFVPMVFMLCATLTSLTMTIIGKIKLIASAGAAWGDWFQMIWSIGLIVLAVILVVEGVQVMTKKEKKQA